MLKFSTQLKYHRAVSKLKGIFPSSIPYEVRIPTGDSSPFFGNYVGQRYGAYDTDTCWDFAMTEMIEDQLALERSLGRFSQEQLDRFKASGFLDKDDEFYLSRRWGAILSGVKDGGNDQALGWKLAERVGMIPFSMLPYSPDDASKDLTREQFVNEYFNPNSVTPEMIALGKEFLKIVNIQSEELGDRYTQRTPEVIKNALKQAPLQLGIPVPYSWNQVLIKWDGGKEPAHSVELYNYTNGLFPYDIYDSYEPHLKQLSSDYYIPLITRGIVTAVKEEMLSPKLSLSIWKQVVQLLRNLGIIIN